MARKKAPAKPKSQSENIKLRERADKVFALLKNEYPEARAALNFGNPFELLIATILSAQCTDARVNIVTPGLFQKYASPKSFAEADRKEIEKEIKSTGFFRQKAKSIINSSKSIVENFAGKVPQTMEQLLTLDGVGRKTANVILGNAFGIPGIPVDTHVGRLSRRLGLSNENDPTKVEFDLRELVHSENWTSLSHLLLFHGRKVCIARLPKCEVCVLSKLCPSAFNLPDSRKNTRRILNSKK